MQITPPPEVRIVYSATAKGVAPLRGGDRPRRGAAGLLVFGLLNVLAAAGLFFVVWQHVDPFLSVEMLFKAPAVPQEQVDQIMASMFRSTDEAGNDKDAEPTPIDFTRQAAGPESHARLIATAARLYITWRGWLVVEMAAVCALALAGGACLARAVGPTGRRLGWIGLGVVVVLAVGGGWYAYHEYHAGIPSHIIKRGNAALACMALLAGMALARAPRGLSTAAAVMLLLATGVSIYGLYVGGRYGILEAPYTTARYFGTLAVLHSAYGWLLLTAVRFMRR